jgi:hypothetical protein
MTNTGQGQGSQNRISVRKRNSVGNGAVGSHYAMLTRLAELDVELAKNATSAGIAVDLSFPKETVGFVSVTQPKQDRPRKK